MEKSNKQKPQLVTVIGVVFIIIAVLVMSGTIGLVTLMSSIGHSRSKYDYIGLIFWGLFIIFNIFTIIASVQFIRLKSWAKTTLEIVSCVGLGGSIFVLGFVIDYIVPTVLSVFFGILFVVLWLLLKTRIIREAVSQRR